MNKRSGTLLLATHRQLIASTTASLSPSLISSAISASEERI